MIIYQLEPTPVSVSPPDVRPTWRVIFLPALHSDQVCDRKGSTRPSLNSEEEKNSNK